MIPLLVILYFAASSAWLIGSGEVIPGHSWMTASREPTHTAPTPQEHPEAMVRLYMARTFSWRGIFGMHPWFALKEKNADHWTVLEVLGWNLRRDKSVVEVRPDAPDRLWYEAQPRLMFELTGTKAESAIPKMLAAAQSYPHPREYRVWPGPNSNTFAAHLIRETPELQGAELPVTAIGKDYLPHAALADFTPSRTGVQLSLRGFAALNLGIEEGIEVDLLGVTVGVDLYPPAIKVPVWGRLGWPNNRTPER
ncbi:MAG: DUF3750 domain-containing protein [Magnetococcales bacterium]|nr:DUF3750 domain-containing protein [Magnetococcales bacterium]